MGVFVSLLRKRHKFSKTSRTMVMLRAERARETKPANYILPFDILVQIFEFIRDTESVDHPLERILAVCHFWHNVALEHRPLWTTFKARIHSHEDVGLWRKRFKHRSDRCGTTALLDITLELNNRKGKYPISPSGVYDTNFHSPVIEEMAYVPLRVLKLFAGKHGSKATRWRHLTLDFLRLTDGSHQRDLLIDSFLQHRTPNLETLRLYGVNTQFALHKMIFPHAPRLRSATFHSCHLSNYPDTSNLASLTWYGSQSNFESENSRIVRPIVTAYNITSLEIGFDWVDWNTPLVFPSVHTLRMPTAIHVRLIGMLRVPSLRRLGLGLDEAGNFALITECKGIPCKQVEILEIFYALGSEHAVDRSHSVIVEKMKILIAHMVSLRTIVWEDDIIKQKALLKQLLDHFLDTSVAKELLKMPGQLTKGFYPRRNARLRIRFCKNSLSAYITGGRKLAQAAWFLS